MKNKNKLIILFLFSITLFFNGCSIKDTSPVRKDFKETKNVDQETFKNNNFNEIDIKDINKIKTPKLEDIKVNFNIDKTEYLLPNKTISITSKGEPFTDIMYQIGIVANMNIIFSEDIDTDKLITLNVKDIKIKNILDIIMDSTKYHYIVKNKIIYVNKYKKEIFKINYLSTKSNFSSKLGGDIFGGVSDENGIKGDFSLNTSIDDEKNDFFKKLEESITPFLSKDGIANINSRTGVIIIKDYLSNVKEIGELINENKDNVSRQILIEAKILEVSLSKNFQTGINWSNIFNKGIFNGGELSIGQNLSLDGSEIANATIEYSTPNFTALLDMISGNGKIRTLSNPRIMVMNGQSALITSGKIVPFWEKEITTSSSEDGSSEITYNRRDVLDGISLGVTPVIDGNGNIILNIIPILTSIEDKEEYIDGGSVVASAPILNIKNLGTVIKTKDNSMIVIGGLISEKTSIKSEGIPGLEKTPGIGDKLFQNNNDSSEKRELVVILRTRVIK